MDQSSYETIGMIAGSGIYPETFMHAARSKAPKCRLVMAAFLGETDENVAAQADECEWFRVGQLSKMIKFFLRNSVKEAVMMGQISPRNLYELRPDMRILIMLAKVKERNAETLFGGIAQELSKDGITLLPATTFLDDHLPAAGHVCGPKLSKRQLGDAAFGFRIAKHASTMDIGQSVVVRHGTVLAVEAFEGTNACIRRGGELGKGKEILLAKVSKPNQDFRFDVPVLGPETIRTCAEAGVHAIAIEARRTLLLDHAQVEKLCAEHQIGIHAIE